MSTDVNTSGSEFDIPMEAPVETPAFEDTMAALQAIINSPERAAAPAPAPAPEKEAAPADGSEKPTEEPDPLAEVLQRLEDEPEAVRDAVKLAIDRANEATAKANELLAERNTKTHEAEVSAAMEQLAIEAGALQKEYPGLTPADLQKTLETLSTLPKDLAVELTFEEVAARALGRDVLAQRRGTTMRPMDDHPARRLSPDAASIIGDATPGAGAAAGRFDPGTGNDFMDIANFITKTDGHNLVLRK